VDYLDNDNPSGKILDGEVLLNGTRYLFDRLYSINLEFEFQTLDLSSRTPFDIAECIQWKIRKNYHYPSRGGQILATLNYDYGKCENITNYARGQFYKPAVWISLIVTLISFVSQYLNFKSIIHRITLFNKVRRLQKQASNNHSKSLGRIGSIYDKASSLLKLPRTKVGLTDFPQFLSVWIPMSFIADISNITGFCVLVFGNLNVSAAPFFLGLGALLTWASAIRYFQYAPSFYVSGLSQFKQFY
jgi:hypothetical protein